MTYNRLVVKSKEHPLKGRKQSPEHVAKRMEAVRLAFQRPEIRAKLYGRPCSVETRAKIGAANSKNLKGRPISPGHRAKMIAGIRRKWAENKANPEWMAARAEKSSKALKGKYMGEKASNWRGGINQNERTDNRIFAWKENILIRDEYTCQICSVQGVFLHIDHIKPWAKHPELRFDESNGRALCRPCHYYVTFKRKMPKGSRWGISSKA